MISLFTTSLTRPALAVLLFVGLGTLPAHAQTLSVGQSQPAGPFGPGMAVITNAGTTAGGFYFYNGAGSLNSQNTFSTLYLTNASTVQITGGSVGSINAQDNSTVNITGGRLFSDSLSSGNIDLYIKNGTVNLFGTNFSKSLYFGTSGGTVYFISGTLGDNQRFSTEAYIAHHIVYDGISPARYVDDGNLNFAAVPETSSAVSLGLLLVLGVGGMALRARRGKAHGAV